MARDYSEDLKIDLNELEKEFEKLPSLYMYWAEQEVNAQEARDRAVQKLSIVQAELDSKIRLNPQKYGLGEKATETAFKGAVANQKEYREAEEDVIAKTKKMRIFSSAVVAMEHKKRSLTKLADLWAGQYWSVSGVPKEMKESINKRKGEEIRKRLNKRNEDD